MKRAGRPTQHRRWIGRASGILALGGSVGSALAADADLALVRTDLVGDATGAILFGQGPSAGDFDGDGYGDLAVGAPGADTVYIFDGSTTGVATPSQSFDHNGTNDYLGGNLAALDVDLDGYDDLAVSATNWASVYLYRGGPAGLSEASETRLQPTPSENESAFGASVANGGDTDGDGFPELVVGDFRWTRRADGEDGAIFVYPGGEGGLDACAETRLMLPRAIDSSDSGLGSQVGANADLNGDGYTDVAGICDHCGEGWDAPRYDADKVYWWAGGARGIGDTPPESFFACCEMGSVPDLDGDGFDELWVWDPFGDEVGMALIYGSPTGPDSAAPVALDDEYERLSGAGDIDGDGFGDMLAGRMGYENGWTLLFGDPSRPPEPESIALYRPEEIYGDCCPGDVPAAAGDLNGDGHPEFVWGSYYSWPDDYSGRVAVYSPVCTWYADADGDGHGDPTVTFGSCHDAGAGWVAWPDDCDDADAATYGATWFSDADADGFGTRAGAVLACTQPAGTSAETGDCDDADAARNPEAEDPDIDGIDQDCDAHDGEWLDTGDCGDAAGDSGADTAAAPGDTGADPTDSASGGGEGAPGEAVRSAHAPGCGCGAVGGTAGGELAGTVLALVAGVRRARRP